MKKIRILVLGVGGNVSLGILKALKMSELDCYVVGACIQSDSVGLYLCDTSYISPYANDSEFMTWVINICNKEKIDIVLTGVEEIILELSKNIDYFRSKTKSYFISAKYDDLIIGQDKLLTCKWLESSGCNYPKYCESTNKKQLEDFVGKIGFPVIAKPKKGKGSNGVLLIKNSNQLEKIYDKEEYIIQEYIGTEEEEYTVGCYFNKNSELVDLIIMNRTLRNGTTQKAVITNNELIEEEARKICSKLKISGPLNIQMRVHQNRAICFELNIRFSGTTPIRAFYGYNDVAAMIKEYVMNMDISKEFSVQNGVALRYVNEIYLDEKIYEEMNKNNYIHDIDKMKIRVDMLGECENN